MNVETEELPDSQIALRLEVDGARVEKAMDAAYRRAAGRVNIAGFRRGKAPRPLVERVVGRESLLQDALNQVLPEAYAEAIRETNLRALTEPEFDVESLEPLRAKATIVVPPPVRLGDYRSIHRDPPSITVKPEEVDEVLGELRERHADWVPVERPTEAGDRVTMDVLGLSAEERAIEQEEISYVIDPKSDEPLPGFAKELIGIAPGEPRSFELSVPAEHRDPDLAGKTMSFTVTIKDVKAKELPDLDDAFATTVGNHADLTALRDEVEQQLRARAEAVAWRLVEEEVLEEVTLFCTVKVPDKLVVQEAQRTRDRLARDLDSRRLTIEQYLSASRLQEEELHARLRADGERALKRGFVLQTIAAEEEVRVSDDEVDAEIQQMFRIGGSDEHAVARVLRDEEMRQRIRTSLVERKAARWLIEHATGTSPDSASQESPMEGIGESER